VDGIGDLRTVMRERYGEKVRLRLVASRPNRFRRWVGRASESSGGFGDAGDWPARALAAVEARLLWSRFGL
jgi:hypothetical protein